jgi:hypothetical protein
MDLLIVIQTLWWPVYSLGPACNPQAVVPTAHSFSQGPLPSLQASVKNIFILHKNVLLSKTDIYTREARSLCWSVTVYLFAE